MAAFIVPLNAYETRNTMAHFYINHSLIRIEPEDRDKDGIIYEPETVTRGVTEKLIPLQERSELRDAMEKVDEDIMDAESGNSTIDVNANLDKVQFRNVSRLDILCALGILPKDLQSATRKIKRNSRGLKGFGSQQKVDISVGKREYDQGAQGGLLKGLFGQGDRNKKE